jgi:hypothetical protein
MKETGPLMETGEWAEGRPVRPAAERGGYFT